MTEAAIKNCTELYSYNVRFDKRLILHSGCALTKKYTKQCYPFAVFLGCEPFLKIYQVGEDPVVSAYSRLAEVISLSDDI